MRQERSLLWVAVAPSLFMLVVVGIAVAGSVAIPHTFVAGTVADASQVNANFQAVRTEINDNDGRITTNTTGIAGHDTRINTLEGAALPSAQGTILGYAWINGGTGDVGNSWMSTGGTPTCTRVAAGNYQITWPGENVLYDETPVFIAPWQSDRIGRHGSGGGGAYKIVQWRDTGGTLVDTDFWVMILQDHNP